MCFHLAQTRGQCKNMKACQVVSQEDLIFDPPQSIAVLFLHEADTNYSSGLIKIYNNEDALFSVHYQSLPKSLLKLNKTEGDLIFLPSWLKIFHHIINDDYIKIVPLKGELPIISHLKLQLLPLFPVPQPFPSDLLISILKASKLTLSTDTIFPIVVSSKMVIFVPKPEKEMPELFSIGNDTEVSFIIPETSKELELDMFAEDIERLMLTLKASRLNLSKETQTHTIFSLSPSAHVQRKAFISGIEKGLGLPKGNCNDIDLDCYAQDEEIENPGDLTEFTKRILSILQTSQNVKLLHLSDCSRFSSHGTKKNLKFAGF